MKFIKLIQRKSLIIGLGCMLSVTNAQSQIIFDDDVSDEAPAAPIDGMIGLSIVAGAFLGLRKKFNQEKQE